MDEDLDAFTRDALVAEVRKLRAAIRQHRDSSGHDLCWHHPGLWALLPDKRDPSFIVPDWPQFMRGCVRYRQSLDAQAPGAPRTQAEFDDRSQPSSAGRVITRRRARTRPSKPAGAASRRARRSRTPASCRRAPAASARRR
ncbi:hypothetical protein J2W23_002754 [Variovorax boronicumulans]|nr:hypothetical protein [Variovorax boronicumulans]